MARSLIGVALIAAFSLVALPAPSAAKPTVAASAMLQRGEVLGEVHFATSCSPAAHAEVGRAVALLHSFSFATARRAFEAALATDATCGIAGWGVAMTWRGNPLSTGVLTRQTLANGQSAIQSARAAGAATERELDYIAAIEAFYEPQLGAPMRIRHLAHEQGMEHIYLRYPDDREAAAFYALALNAAADPTDKTYVRQLQAGTILEQLFVEQPNHPGAAHYLIHSYDYPTLASRGLSAARRYASIAPSVPHALHMPSHIFTRLGLWDESIASNTAAAGAIGDPGGRLHEWDYMVYAHLQRSQDSAAKAVVEQAKQATTTNTFSQAVIPARYAIETRAWTEAAALVLIEGQSATSEAVVHQARAMGAARIGDASTSNAAVQRLDELHGILAARGSNSEYWAGQVGIWRLEAGAWLARAEGRNDDAVRLMRSAADAEDVTDKDIGWPGPITPAREMLGELLLDIGRGAEALPEFVAVQRREPNRFWAVYGAGRAAELSGNPTSARESYAQLVQISDRADTDRPALVHARAYLAPR